VLEEDYLGLEKDFDDACEKNEKCEADNQKYRFKIRDLEAECHNIKEYAADCLKKYEKLAYENGELRELKERLEEDYLSVTEDLQKVQSYYKRLMGTHAITMFELDRMFQKMHGDTDKYKSTHNRVIEGILGHGGRTVEHHAPTPDVAKAEGKSPLRRRARVGVLAAGTGEKRKSGSETGLGLVSGFNLGNPLTVGGKPSSDVKPAGASMLSGLISAQRKETESAKVEDESAKKSKRRDKR
jgi:hypothetical protein